MLVVRVRRKTGDTYSYYHADGTEYTWDNTTNTGHFTYYHQIAGQTIAYTTSNDSKTTWMFKDHISSTSVTRDDAGVMSTQRYTPWGELRTDGNLTTDHTYTGQVEDVTTGLSFYNARYYDPAIGRFASPDSVVPDARSGQDYNRYSYVRNNPIRYTDPTGHCPPNLRHALECAPAYDPSFKPAVYVEGVLIESPSTLWTIDDIEEEQAQDRRNLDRRSAEGQQRLFSDCDGDLLCIAETASDGQDQFAAISAGCTLVGMTGAGAPIGVPCATAAEVGGITYGAIELAATCSDDLNQACTASAIDFGTEVVLIGVIHGPLKEHSSKIYISLGGNGTELVTSPGELVVAVANDASDALNDYLSRGRDDLGGRGGGGSTGIDFNCGMTTGC